MLSKTKDLKIEGTICALAEGEDVVVIGLIDTHKQKTDPDSRVKWFRDVRQLGAERHRWDTFFRAS